MMSSPTLRLFLDLQAENADQTVEMAEMLLENHLPASAELQIIDVADDPDAARAAGVMAIPTLEISNGGTARRAVGDLADAESVLAALAGDTEQSSAQGDVDGEQ